jgi:MarR family transcriptional regulator, lower aerobic nicotinate degradation pathway regulator
MLYWVTHSAGQFYARAVATVGLTPPQVAILQLLSLEGPLVQARLADRLQINKATMVPLLNELEAQHLVVRQPHPTDKRAFIVSLTQAGHERAAAVARVNQAADQIFFAALTPDERATFQALLRRLATSPMPTDFVPSDAPNTPTT